MSRIPGETDVQIPAVEFNWGPLPNTHLHIILPATGFLPDHGVRAYGFGDIELGIKYRFVQRRSAGRRSAHLPCSKSQPVMPTGAWVWERTWYRVPLWVQKSFGPWTAYGGGGENVMPAEGYRNNPFAGLLVQREVNKKLTLGSEVYYHGPMLTDSRYSALLDIGGYYKFHGNDSFQMLFCYGHSVSGEREQYAYLGLYWTWGRRKTTSPAINPQLLRSTNCAPVA